MFLFRETWALVFTSWISVYKDSPPFSSRNFKTSKYNLFLFFMNRLNIRIGKVLLWNETLHGVSP